MPLETKRVKVVRAFYFNREAVAVGAELTVPKLFALEMIATGKCVAIDESAKAVTPPPQVKVETYVGKVDAPTSREILTLKKDK